MSFTFESLRAGGTSYRVEATVEGITLHPAPDQADAFTALVQQIVDHSGVTYIAFCRSDRKGGFDRVFVLPIASPIAAPLSY